MVGWRSPGGWSRGPTVTGPLLSAEQAASRLGLARPRTVLEMARRGELGHVRVGRLVRFREEDLAAYVAANYVPPRPAPAAAAPGASPPIPAVVPPNPRRSSAVGRTTTPARRPEQAGPCARCHKHRPRRAVRVPGDPPRIVALCSPCEAEVAMALRQVPPLSASD